MDKCQEVFDWVLSTGNQNDTCEENVIGMVKRIEVLLYNGGRYADFGGACKPCNIRTDELY